MLTNTAQALRAPTPTVHEWVDSELPKLLAIPLIHGSYRRNTRSSTSIGVPVHEGLNEAAAAACAILRVGLFAVLFSGKGLVSALGALASMKLLRNAYPGAMLLMSFIGYLAFLVLSW